MRNANPRLLAVVTAACLWTGCGESSSGPPLDPRSEPSESRAAPEEVLPVAERAEARADPGSVDESPFESESFHEVVGLGGGAGGKFGGRFAGTALPDDGGGRATYAPVRESGFRLAALEPLSTFSIDVDTASYTNVRRHLVEGRLPPRDAVRIEELVNAFRYGYPSPEAGRPFSVTTEVASCPWRPQHRLVRVGLAAEQVDLAGTPPANLVFLVDVSGSMSSADKLPLVVQGLRMLVGHLRDEDTVALVVYAGASGLVLPPTPCARRTTILDALGRLTAGGSTAGAAGIQLAYDVARDAFVEDGLNRVVLATDGDFNVGISDRGALEDLIAEQARSGVFLSVLGFGTGDLRDDVLETLADRGNGNYAYVDSLAEARRVLVTERGGTLVTVASDVKLQVEWNPAEVTAWRRIGYENRELAHTDFTDDTRDAGEIGAGHTVTALFEVVPVGVPFEAVTEAPALRYRPSLVAAGAAPGELGVVRLRWKTPGEDTSVGADTTFHDAGATWFAASDDLRFAAAVASFGMLLRDSEHRGDADLRLVRELAREGTGDDPRGARAGFARLVERAAELGLE